jgi:NADPH2:quinone reductase
MKVMQYIAFGGSDVIQPVEVEQPGLEYDEVLIKAAAVTFNPANIKFRTGSPQGRMPVQQPFIPELDVSCTVAAIGKNVSRINAGDQVYGESLETRAF